MAMKARAGTAAVHPSVGGGPLVVPGMGPAKPRSPRLRDSSHLRTNAHRTDGSVHKRQGKREEIPNPFLASPPMCMR